MLMAGLLKGLGHRVVLYGVIENEAPCDEFVSCIGPEEYKACVGDTPYQYVPFDEGSKLFLMFNARAAQHIRGIKQPTDIIATIAGSAQQFVSEHHPELRFLEYSIGYRGVTAPYRVFQSHAWRHVVSGYTGVDGGRPFDAVIPPWYETEHYPWSDTAGDYVLFCGRVVEGKGISLACKAAEAAGVRLVVIGHGNPALVTYGELLGAVPTAQRNLLMAGARAVLMPTQYLEPFGNVAAEAQLSGTPVIGPDFGAFVETIDQGVSGYRCVTIGEYVQAIDQSRHLNRTAIRQRAERLWGLKAAESAYRGYFARLDALQGAGTDSLAPTLAA
jgi:glycosyltransferase involved in cell wall biosynthesis